MEMYKVLKEKKEKKAREAGQEIAGNQKVFGQVIRAIGVYRDGGN